jgi:hypothetical protein
MRRILRGFPAVFEMFNSVKTSSTNRKQNSMSVSVYRVSMSFVQLPDGSLGDFANGVITGMGSVPAFAAAPVTMVVLGGLRDTFIERLAATVNGGKLATAAKNVARAALIAGLRQDASYVQTLAATDLPLLLSSGYQAVSTNRTSAPLVKPIITNVDNFQSTKLMIGANADVNTKAQELRYRTGTNPYQSGGVHTKPTRMLLEDLIPGTTYELQTRSVGGSAGYSDWSDPVSHMAT